MATDELIQPVQLLSSFIFIIGLIFACAWLVRRTNGAKLLTQRHIKIKSSLSLGAKEKIVIIEVGKEQHLIGVCSGQISLLKTLDEPLIDSTSRSHDFSEKIIGLVKRGQVDKQSNEMDTAK